MTRIDHTNHSHPRTPEARATCRKLLASAPFQPGSRVWAKLDDAPEQLAVVVAVEPWGNGVRYMCTFPSGWVHGTTRVRGVGIDGEHCRQCGRPDESNRYNDGYSSCCNMRIVDVCDPTDCFHK